MAIEEQYKASKKKEEQVKNFNFQINTNNLPNTTQAGTTDENEIASFIKVLRKTHEKFGDRMVSTRVKEKKQKQLEEKLKNPNFVKNELFKEKMKKSLKRKIRLMRNQAIFPQPKSYMNYTKRKGLLKKNSIKINE